MASVLLLLAATQPAFAAPGRATWSKDQEASPQTPSQTLKPVLDPYHSGERKDSYLLGTLSACRTENQRRFLSMAPSPLGKGLRVVCVSRVREAVLFLPTEFFDSLRRAIPARVPPLKSGANRVI